MIQAPYLNRFHGWSMEKWSNYWGWSNRNPRPPKADIGAYILQFEQWWAVQRLTGSK